MGHNRAGENRKKRLKRRKKLEQQQKAKLLRSLPPEEMVTSLHIKVRMGETLFLKNKDFDTIEWGLPHAMPFMQAVKWLADFFGKPPKTVDEGFSTCSHSEEDDLGD